MQFGLRRSYRYARPLVALAVSGLLGACVGSQEPGSEPEPVPEPPGPAVPTPGTEPGGSPGGQPGGGDSGGGSTGGVPCGPSEALPVDQPRRLNITELNTIAADVLGLDDTPFAVVGNDYRERYGPFLGMSERFLSGYLEASEAVAGRYISGLDLAALCPGASSPPPPPADECNTTAECRAQHGSRATDCVNSQSDQSYCACGGERCVPPSTPSPGGVDETLVCAERVLRPVIEQLLRRPVSDAALSRYTRFVETARGLDLSFVDGLTAGLSAVFMSPDFLIVGSDSESAPGPQVLDGYARAERLALALWDSVPDAELREAARSGALDTDAGLEAQVRRMLEDPEKGGRLLDGFIASHFDLPSETAVPLGLEALGARGTQLAADMRQEAVLLIEALFERNLSVDRLVEGRTAFLNQRLAEHYGIAGVSGEAFEEVSTEGTPRVGGLLTSGAVLAQEGDLIHRGVNVLQSFLCQDFAAPDPALVEAALARLPDNASDREQVEFRKDSGCAGCHMFIDPLGAAFEGFDGAGQPRERYENGDSVLYESDYQGQKILGPEDVSRVVLESQMRRCIASKVLGWVSFRRLLTIDRPDRCAADALLDQVSSEAGVRDLFIQSFSTPTFQSRVVGQP